MKRLMTISFFAVMLCVSIFADSYHDALVQYMQMGNVIDKGQYIQMFEPIIGQLYPTEKEQVSAVFGEYAASQMMSDITDLYEPAFRSHVSEAELKELADIYSDPRFADMKERSMRIVSTLANTEEYAAFVQQFQQAFASIAAGQMPADMPYPTNVPVEYREAFMQYYADSRIDETVMSSFRAMTDMLVNALRQQGIANPEQKVESIMQYTGRNMPIMMLPLFYKSLTLEDIQLSSTVTSKPAYIHAMDAVNSMTANPMQLGLGLFRKIADWMSVHYPMYVEPLRLLISEMEKTVL